MNVDIHGRDYFVKKAADKIMSALPEAEDITVNLEQDRNGNFSTKIHLRWKKRFFSATKSNSDLPNALQKTTQALMKQLEQMKTKRERGWKKKNYHFHHVAMA